MDEIGVAPVPVVYPEASGADPEPRRRPAAAARPPKAAEARLRGTVDFVSEDRIAGWAWNEADPQATVVVEVLDGDELLLRVAADMPRPDLLAAGFGTGKYGFKVTGIGKLLPHSRHRVRVCFADTGADLHGSPDMLVKASAGFDAAAQRFAEAAVTSTAASARSVEEVDQALAALLGLVNQLVNVRARLDEERLVGPAEAVLEEVALRDLSDWTRELALKVARQYKPLALPEVVAPTVSVIVPVHGKFATTYNCLESIVRHLPEAAFEVIIVDDCSSDETIFASFVFSGAVRVLRLAQNQGFVGACNAGAAAASGEFLFFLNNDTLVREGWLDSLLDTFEAVPNVGIAGAKLLFADGVLQEAGGIIWRMGDGWNWGRGADPMTPKFNFLRDVDYVSGAALMLRKALFDRLGGFDEHYRPAYYEDTDLCFRVRAAGQRVVVQPASEIVHLEGVSNGTDTGGAGLKRYQVINHRKFVMRWQSTLMRHRLNPQEPELEAERMVRRRAYFIDETVLTPDQDAGSNAALQHIKALQRLGYKVTFIPSDNMARIDPYTRALEKIGVECVYAPYFWSVEEVFRKCAAVPDLFYIHRYVNASKYGAMIREHFPKARIIYNVADVHFLREERQAAIEGDAALAAKAAQRRERELAAMRQVDCVIVHSMVEADMLRALLPSVPVQVAPWAVKLARTEVPFVDRAGCVFVGGFRHHPNVDAVSHFVASILPLSSLDETHALHVVGSHMPDSLRRLHGPRVNMRGQIAELADVMHHMRCAVAPLRYGAGIKGKVLESFAHGLPCVMTPVAAEGLPLSDALQWLVADTDAAFAEKLDRLLTDADWNASLAEAGIAMLQQHFSEAATQAALADSLTAGVGRPTAGADSPLLAG